MDEVRWERMFPDELERAFVQRPLVYFPYGLCEPHGPQNALGLDALKAHAIACRAARAFGGIVAPADYWHIHEIGGYGVWAEQTIGSVPRTWLTSLPPWQHFRNVLYHIRTADSHAFHAAILLTGHYGPNWQDLRQLVEAVQPYVGTRLYSLPDFEANRPGFDRDGKSGGDHAGKVETSLLWALESECVDVSRLPSEVGAHPWAMGYDAARSDRRAGERMVEDEVRFLVARARELLAEYDRLKPTHRLLTFADVEDLWRRVASPLARNCMSMQPRFGDQEPLRPDSTWYANSQVPPWPEETG